MKNVWDLDLERVFLVRRFGDEKILGYWVCGGKEVYGGGEGKCDWGSG